MRILLRALAGIILSLLTTLALVAPPNASAASGYTIAGVAAGSGITTTDKAIKLAVTLKKSGKAVRKATAALQYLKGSTWVTEKKVKVRRGKGSTTVKHGVGDRTYRFTVKGKATSAPFTVHFVPATFVVAGAGWGHGVGMSQWGAYELAREGRSAADILVHYYPGATLGTANNNPRTVKVQVLGPPADSRTTTRLSLTSGGFTIAAGATIATTRAGTPVAIGVNGSRATARVTLANGKAATLTSSRLVVTWNTAGSVTVAGAQGSYRYGNLQVTVIGSRPNVVNELRMNTEYLYGIDEMPSSWGSSAGRGIEALKAQVVAARTYVITQAAKWKTGADPLGVNPACDCQVFDDSRSQNFTGAKKAAGAANAPWRTAVDATVRANAAQPNGSEVDVVRAPDAGIAETPYFASSGTSSASGATTPGTVGNADAWGTAPVSYLTHVPDPYSALAPGNPHLRWTSTPSQAKVAALFGLGPLRSVQVTERYAGGLVKSLTATSAAGATRTITRTSEGWRTGLGLPGAWVAGIAGR